MQFLADALGDIQSFMQSGGPVLYLIAGLAFIMWVLIIERLLFFKGALTQINKSASREWEARSERTSWNAHQIREAMVSKVVARVNENLDIIGTMVALCPLMGLLGTVTGMIEVFNVLAITGGGDAKSMASGVSRATIPTMAGMVAALSGVFGMTLVNRIAERENHLADDQLTMDH